MTKTSILTAFLLSALTVMPVAYAQNTHPVPTAQSGKGNSDLMASNTVRAIFRGVQQITVHSYTNPQAQTTQVAVFEVVANLAHRRYVRYGDGLLAAGTIFTVSMDKNHPGQPSSIVDEISHMQVGEEAVMKIDHLFLFADPEGQNIRPCTRLARKPSGTTTAPTTTAPIHPTVPDGATIRQPSAPRPVIQPGNGSGAGSVFGIEDDNDTIVE